MANLCSAQSCGRPSPNGDRRVRPAIRTTGPWRLACLERRLSKAGVNVLLDTNVLLEPMRERPDAVVMADLEQGGHRLHTASMVIYELSDGIQRPAFAGDMQHQRLCGV